MNIDGDTLLKILAFIGALVVFWMGIERRLTKIETNICWIMKQIKEIKESDDEHVTKHMEVDRPQ